MKTVLLAAAGSLFLTFSAHAAGSPKAPDAGGVQAPVTRALRPVSAAGSSCIDTATVSRTAYGTDEDAEAGGTSCTQFLSTQTLVQPPAEGRT